MKNPNTKKIEAALLTKGMKAIVTWKAPEDKDDDEGGFCSKELRGASHVTVKGHACFTSGWLGYSVEEVLAYLDGVVRFYPQINTSEFKPALVFSPNTYLLPTMASTFFDKWLVLRELGWSCAWETSDGNSTDAKWEPTEAQGPNADVYIFEGWHRSSGPYLRVIWAESFAEAEAIYEAGNGVPDFYPKNAEQLRVLLACTRS
jgi:hypothetical protein